MKSTALRIALVLILLSTISFPKLFAQQARALNVVTTAVPMGDRSLATDPDASSPYFNLGKVPFNTSVGGVNVTYTPWLKRIVPDVYLASLAGYYKMDETSAISASSSWRFWC